MITAPVSSSTRDSCPADHVFATHADIRSSDPISPPSPDDAAQTLLLRGALVQIGRHCSTGVQNGLGRTVIVACAMLRVVANAPMATRDMVQDWGGSMQRFMMI